MYIGRFAPSPTGPLHAGSLLAALGSWLDARAHRGRWLVRIEDVDTPRCPAGIAEHQLWQLARCGLQSDEPVLYQSSRGGAYAAAVARLSAQHDCFACGCSRRDIDEALAAQGLKHERHAERVYPGTCRAGLHGKPARALRLRSDADGADVVIAWTDRRLGPQQQNLTREVGDFVLQRADGLWAYQLAVVVDDAHQGVTAVVRGEDLADNTARQIHLQRRLGLPTPSYLHLPLLLGDDGGKLSKQNGAAEVDLADEAAVVRALHAAATGLGLLMPALPASAAGPARGELLAQALAAWRTRLDAGIITSHPS